MSRLNLTITVDEEHIGATKTIAATLESQGFVVERVVARAGAIFGSADEKMLEGIEGLKGVQEVRAAREYQHPVMSPRIPQ